MKSYLLIVALSILSLNAFADGCYSEGIRVGTVQKFSNKGFKNKSWEGELVMEGQVIKSDSKGRVIGGNVWKFSVFDGKVADQINNSVMSGHKVALKYCQIILPMFSSDTPYRITQAVERKD